MAAQGAAGQSPHPDVARYYAVAASNEIRHKSIFRSRLLGSDLVLWRADSDRLNAWEDRCPHRSVRLSLGTNLGSDLRCQYHGMRFRSDDGACITVPSEPAQLIPRSLRPKIFSCAEHSGFIWVSLSATALGPRLMATSGLTLRSVWFEAPTLSVREAIQGYRFGPESRCEGGRLCSFTYELLDPYCLKVISDTDTHQRIVTLLIQPVDNNTTIVHGRLEEKVGAADRIASLRHHNERMAILRDRVERNARIAASLKCS